MQINMHQRLPSCIAILSYPTHAHPIFSSASCVFSTASLASDLPMPVQTPNHNTIDCGQNYLALMAGETKTLREGFAIIAD